MTPKGRRKWEEIAIQSGKSDLRSDRRQDVLSSPLLTCHDRFLHSHDKLSFLVLNEQALVSHVQGFNTLQMQNRGS